ncbi:MAG: hypothetical protein HZA32_04055 [Opitutae bacterium]|nr:hypothetical protein [Opitutae bacterium]
MPPAIELVPNQATLAKPLFPTEEAYNEFRESFMEEAIPELDRLLEARRKSEQEARQRLLK